MEPLLVGGDSCNAESTSAVTEELDRLCRICASPNDYLIPIFEGEGLDHELAMKIEKYLPVKISDGDTLPLNVCYQCASTLIAWHDLFENSVKADKKLRELEDRKVFVDKLSDIYEGPPSVGSDDETFDQPSTSSAIENQGAKDSSTADKCTEISSKDESSQKTQSPAEEEGYRHMPRQAVSGNIAPVGDNPIPHEKANDHSNNTIENIMNLCKVELLEMADMRDFKCVKYNRKHETKIRNIKTRKIIQQRLSRNIVTPFNETRNREENSAIDIRCNICDKNFFDLRKLKEHIKSHKNKVTGDTPKAYICQVCQEGFNLKSELLKHMEVHNMPKSVAPPKGTVFTCDICGKKYSSKRNLFTHFIYHREKSTCHLCGKRFTFSGFRYHLKHVHGGSKNFHCDICDKKFVSKGNLRDHMRIHTGDKPYMCPTCGKFFRKDSALHHHKATHTDIYPFSCSVCNKSFRRKKELNYHRMTHSGVKPCSCDICGKTFRDMSEVRIHKVIHFDERPFVCTECGKCFKHVKYLKRHVKSHQKLA